MKAPKWLARTRTHRHASDSSTCPECGAKMPLTTCEVCGYDMVQRTRDSINPRQGT